jgi:uncharacterized membrane protein
MTKNRVEAFSDGVFAIAITLLVIELRPPEVSGTESLADALWDMWPGYVAYLISFAILGVMWLNHHRMFEQVELVDGPLLLLNLNLLLWAALIPFPTAVVADYFAEGGDNASTAVAFYSGVVLITAISFTMLFTWITHDDRILGRPLPAEVLRASRLRFGIGVGVYSLALAVAFFAPKLALGIHALSALYYAFDQATLPSDASQFGVDPGRS